MTEKTTVTGILETVGINDEGKYCFALAQCGGNGPANQHFALGDKALMVANSDGAFPVGVQVKVTGRFNPISSAEDMNPNASRKLTHVKINSVDGVEITAWSQRVGSPTTTVDAQERVEAAEKAEAAMTNKAPPEQPGAITDPVVAYENAMRIVRRQRRLKNPQLSQQEIWQVRDALNLLAEKLGIS